MLRTLQRRVWLVALCVSALLGGAVLGSPCDGNYCNPDTSNCLVLDQQVQDTCCVDLDHDGVSHCATCTREMYECWDSSAAVLLWGPPYDCTTGGAECR